MKRLAVALVSAAFLAITFAATPGAAQTTAPPMSFGMDANSVAAQTAAGVKPDYGTFWVGPWTLKHGWGGPDSQMTSLKNAGVTPAIHFYYWGDDISKSCIENGCWSSLHTAQKDKAGWQRLAQELVDRLNARMAGAPVIIFLETEFNKADVQTYEALDGYLTEKAQFIRAGYPQAKIVMALGNWNSAAWPTWDRTAAASDYTGIQGMRGSTRDSLASYQNLYESTLAGAQKLQSLFQKPVFIQDLALSTYPEPEYLAHQAKALQKFFTGMASLKAAGVQAMSYRTWTDNPNMDLANYYGQAERHWGFSWALNKTQKPSADVWISGVRAERAGSSPPPPPPPNTFPVPATGAQAEVDAFASKSAGGVQSDAAASGGRAWNLWSNGHVAQTFAFEARQYDLVVRARSTLLGGVRAHMDVTLGGGLVLAADPGTGYADHVARVVVPAQAELRIHFTNDARSSSEDRNLVLDYVRFLPVNEAPTARFSAQATGLSVSVDGRASSDPEGQPLTYAWTFGDGVTASEAQAAHTYGAAGTYVVRLQVSDGQLSHSTSQSVTVQSPNRAPTARFTAAASGLDVSLDATASTDPDGDPLSYTWTFGDGAAGSGVRAQHTYSAPGTYAVNLTVSDGSLSETTTQAVVVRVAPLEARFDVSPNVNAWWVEVKVTANHRVESVTARIGSGAPLALTPTSWGTWAKSVNAPHGSTVVFQATDGYRQTASHTVAAWMGEPFSASFTPKAQTNRNWIEVVVTADQALAKVEARVDGGGWFELPPTKWDSYAKTVKVTKRSMVDFRATSTSGEFVVSSPYPWG